MTPLLAAAALALTIPGVAHADTASFDGSTVRIQGSDGNESITLSLSQEGKLRVNTDEAGAGCQKLEYAGEVECPLGAGGIVVDMRGGSDKVTHLGLSEGSLPSGSLHVDLGAGDDTFTGDAGREVVAGGDGNDTLTGGPGDDLLDGGNGNDTLTGDGGRDELRGGDGDDALDGDRFDDPAADVIDGGPGNDLAEGWAQPDHHPNPPASVTLNGQADDGRPGEGDNVSGIERVTAHVSGTVELSDAADTVEMWANLDYGASTIKTFGGDDQVTAGNGSEAIDGGTGNDRIDAGYGDDTIVGGPGRDQISADKAGSECGLFESCSLPIGNDVVDVRDGEADSVSCGFGDDNVQADSIDTVAPDCEHVTRSSGGGATPGGGQDTPGTGADAKRCTVPKLTGLRLASAKRKLASRGCRAKVRYVHSARKRGTVVKAGARPGKKLPAGTRVTVSVSRGR
jgi:Ca2+-binding RTX toxin-like protein